MTQQRNQHSTSPRRPTQPQPSQRSRLATTQHHHSPHRESDLQPVYDFIGVLQPSHLRTAWRRTNRHTRWLMFLMVAGVILLWSVMRISAMVANHIETTTGTFLREALKAPYSLETRYIPTIDLTVDPETISVLPAMIGSYTLQAEAVEAPAVEPALPDAAAPAAEEPIVETSVIVYPMSNCLEANGTPVDKEVCVTTEAQLLETGTYENAQGQVARVTIAQFLSNNDAAHAARDLHRFAFSIGSVGNFALDIGEVDYFYSTITDQYTFVWSHRNWVYLVSGPTFDVVETVVTTFPY